MRRWLTAAGRITSGDVADVTTFTTAGALNALNRMVGEGLLTRGDASRGRHAHFVAASPDRS